MRHASHRNLLPTVALALLALHAAGCKSLPGTRRPEVAQQLACRMGEPLGPQKPPCDPVIPDFVVWDDGLSENEAVIVGLWNNPSYQQLLADLQIARADLITAGQLTNPEINTLIPISPKDWEFYVVVPIDMLWLRPRRVAIAQLENQRVAQRLVQDGLDVIRTIRVAYADLVLAEQRFQLAKEGLQLRKRVAAIGEARLRAGAVGELDVSPVRLEALFGTEEVVRTEQDVNLARQRLRFQMGIAMLDVPIHPRPDALNPPPFDTERLVAEATSARPDLRAVRFAFTAALERAGLARYDYLNISGFLPDINGVLPNVDTGGFEIGPGLRFNLPIFHQNQGARARARAEAERLQKQFVTLRDTAATDVRLANTQLVQAQQTLAIWRDQVVPRAQAAANSAGKALQEDAVSLLVVLETTRQLLNGRARELDASANLRRAMAELERSVGRRVLTPPPAQGNIEEVPAPQLIPEPRLPFHESTTHTDPVRALPGTDERVRRAN